LIQIGENQPQSFNMFHLNTRLATSSVEIFQSFMNETVNHRVIIILTVTQSIELQSYA